MDGKFEHGKLTQRFLTGSQHATEKRPCTGMTGLTEDLLGRALLDQFALIEHHHTVGHLAGKTHFVGDHDHGHAFFGQFLHHLQHFTRSEGEFGAAKPNFGMVGETFFLRCQPPSLACKVAAIKILIRNPDRG